MIGDIIQYAFFQNALIGGLLASLACGIIGTFVVVKRISTISGSISHAAFGGIGMGYFFGFNPLLGAIGFGLISAGLMGVVRFKLKEREDTLIGALWAVGMALGIIFIYMSSGYAADLLSYLFGNILLTSRADLVGALLLNGIILVTVFAFFNGFQAISFDEEYATVTNLPVFRLYLLLLGVITLTVILLIKLVGVILVIALLTLPAASAEHFAKSLPKMMAIAVFIGSFATVSGIFISYGLNLPSGPIIILLCFIIYLATLLGKHKLVTR